MRKLLLVAILATLFLVAAAPVLAHVHGVTPLNGCSVDNANSGGAGTDGTPADDANGGPISGLIPRDTGESSLTIGDGGFSAATGNCP